MINILKKKKKYIGIFVVKEQGNYNIMSKKKFNPFKSKIKYGKDLFLINVRYPTYVKGLRLFYFIDVKTGTQISFRKLTKSTYDPSYINLMLGESTIIDLVSGLGVQKTLSIMTLILGIIIGALGGFIAKGYM